MTVREVAELVEQYREGLSAQLALLHQLVPLANRQTACTESRDFEQLTAESDERDRLTRGLAAIDESLSEVRHRLSLHKTAAMSSAAWHDVVALRDEALELVSQVLSADRESLKCLSDGELARRAALTQLEKSETTLAAYRRVLTPPVEHAALVDRRG